MLRPFGSEQGHFSLFLLLVFAAAFLFTLPVSSVWASGLSIILWGGFGAWRLATLSFAPDALRNGASLPARLMATLAQRESRLREEGHTRLHQADIQLWFALGCAYALWTLANFLLPAVPGTLISLQLSLNEFWQGGGPGSGPEIKLGGNPDALIRQLSFLFCCGVAAFTVHSFSYNETFIRQAALLLLPVFTVCAIVLATRGTAVVGVSYLDDLSWRGAGAGAATVMTAIVPELREGQSSLMQRWIEQGLCGVLFVYGLYALPAMAMVRFMIRSGRRMVALLSLATMAAMLCLDVLMMAGGWVSGLLFMGTSFAALAWGHSAYLRPFWAPVVDSPVELDAELS